MAKASRRLDGLDPRRGRCLYISYEDVGYAPSFLAQPLNHRATLVVNGRCAKWIEAPQTLSIVEVALIVKNCLPVIVEIDVWLNLKDISLGQHWGLCEGLEFNTSSRSNRGGAASSVRSKLSRKIQRSEAAPINVLQLIQVLWPVAAAELQAIQGQPDQAAAALTDLSRRHGAVLVGGVWQLSKQAPWAKATRNLDTTSHGQSKVEEFELAKITTRFVSDDAKEIPIYPREEFNAGDAAVVLCSGKHLHSCLAGLPPEQNIMILTDSIKNADIKELGAVQTKIIVDNAGKPKAMTAWAITKGTVKIASVQKAVQIQKIVADTIWVRLTMDKELASQADYLAFGDKGKMSLFLGSMAGVIHISTRRIAHNDARVTWNADCPRASLRELLSLSGKQLNGLEHCGVSGPTRTGQCLVRALQPSVAAIRQQLLGQTSPFSSSWDMVIKHKVAGRFPADASAQTITVSLAKSMDWKCVLLSQKAVGKKWRWLTFGSDSYPPSWEVAWQGHVIILEDVQKNEDTKLAVTFEAPKNEYMEVEQLDGTKPLPEAVLKACQNASMTTENKVMDRKAAWEKNMEMKLEAVLAKEQEAIGMSKAAMEEAQGQWMHATDSRIDKQASLLFLRRSSRIWRPRSMRSKALYLRFRPHVTRSFFILTELYQTKPQL